MGQQINMGINRIAGIKDDDIEWAYSLADQITKTPGKMGGLGTKGDAARHLALGWLAGQSSLSPEQSTLQRYLGKGWPLAAIQLNETKFFPTKNNVEQAQDRKNNELGFELAGIINTKEEFEKTVKDMFSDSSGYSVVKDVEAAKSSKVPVVLASGTPAYTGSSYKATKQ